MNSLLSWTKSVCVLLSRAKTDDAIEKLAVLVDRAADVERALKALERSERDPRSRIAASRSAAC